ncbi:MAG: UDP-N-acetylglucosamine--N-acetylmuramyl-(pentapeptide) pyrophosphoryl-undecaprenol N-acetylglucosamine transferase [Candidatus Levybacteria bacterium]|nr:UDP-N-acetylglucosamine--N-acetylmuramyl-(pentapeptide) pyrophosphoryl-undecaprenol N-acetylglucosamine transferase [Candidatus Levybacteria bacterium]
MRIVLTGGHISPALSVIENLPVDAEVFFIGRKSTFEGDKSPSFEYQVIKGLNIPFFNLPNARLQRKFTLHTVPSLLKLPYALYRAAAILRKIKPDVVLGFGGYISLPVCTAAYFLKIPVVIHEQTLEAGFANSEIAKWAKMICISWKTSQDFFPKSKTVLTGNPIRKEILELKVEGRKSKVPILYITGGSSGSHFINELVGEILPKLLLKFHVIHQTGDSKIYNDFDKLLNIKKSLSKTLSEKYDLRKFTPVAEVGHMLQNATLVIGRAGINTITELAYLKKPALLIPLPFAQNNEQKKNALFLKDIGLAQVLEQGKFSPLKFVSKINEMTANIDSYTPKEAWGNLIDKNAALHIVSVVSDVAKKEK